MGRSGAERERAAGLRRVSGRLRGGLTTGHRPLAAVLALSPIAAQVDWRIGTSGFGLFGGLRWVSATGEAIAEDFSLASGERLEFRMLSWRVGPAWSVLRGLWGFGIGAGLAYNSYREQWDAAGLRTEDSGVGAVFQGSVERRFSRRLSALLRVEYLMFEADTSKDTGLGSVSLGGLDIAGGVSFRF